MNLSDLQILPYPNAVFYLTGLSIATLVYVTFASTINAIPGAITSQFTTVSDSIGAVAQNTANDLYSKVATTTQSATDALSKTAASASNTLEKEGTAAMSNVTAALPTNNTYAAPNPSTNTLGSITKSISNLNPFGQGEKPPVQTAGSAKRRKKASKKTKRRKSNKK